MGKCFLANNLKYNYIASKYFFKILLFINFISIFFLLYSCERCQGNSRNENTTDSVSVTKKVETKQEKFVDPYPIINYKLDTIKSRKQLAEVISKFKKYPDSINAIKAFKLLNRKETRFMSVGSAVVIPDTIIKDLKAYSVFPQVYEGARKLKKLIVVSNRYLSYACYDSGRLVRFAACNTGKEKTPSYPGRYAMNWREKLHRSSIDSSWVMPFTFNFHKEAGSAFHQFDMPGKPASHSCIRQFAEDAEWLYNWSEGIKKDSNGKFIPMSGTPVIIIDYYDFEKDKGNLWKRIKSNKDLILDLPKNPMDVEEALIPICQIPKESRWSLVNIKRYKYAEDTLRARGVIRAGVKLTETKNFNKLKREKLKIQEKRMKKLG